MVLSSTQGYSSSSKKIQEINSNPKQNKVKAITKEDYYLTLDKKNIRDLKVFLEYNGPIKTPVQKDQKIANLIVQQKDEVIKTLPLYASEKISKVNFFKSLVRSLNYLIWGDV